jgi:hypothetical protein
MDNHQDIFSKFGSGGGGVGGNDGHNRHDSLLGTTGGGSSDDDPFNDSGGDFFDKFLEEEAARNNGLNSSMLLGGNDSSLNINATALLDAELNRSSVSCGDMNLEMRDMEGNDQNNANANINNTGGVGQVLSHSGFTGGQATNHNGFANFVGNAPLSSGIQKPDNLRNSWFLPGGAAGGTSPAGANNNNANAVFQNNASSQNRHLNLALDAAPLNVSLGSGITSTLRRKGSNVKLNPSKAKKANVTSSKMRSTKRDGLLARALKARYNSSGQVNNYNVNAAGAAALISAKLPRNSMSALQAVSGMSQSGMNQMRGSGHGSALFASSNSQIRFNSVEQEPGSGGGTQNATWGQPPNKRKNGNFFSDMLAGSSNNNSQVQKNPPNIVSSNSTSSLLHQQVVLSGNNGGSASGSSMQDLLRLCKLQSKTQTLLRQSSAHSLMKQTSSQSLKDMSKKVDVSSLLPPQHASKSLNNHNHNNSNNIHGPQHNNNNNNSRQNNNPAQPSANNNNAIETSSLLHQSCRLYPTTAAVVESALRIDPDAVRKAIPITLEKGSIISGSGGGKKAQNIYGYPVNVAMTHGASMEVLKMLVEAGPDVLIQKDGTDGSGSLGIALTTKCEHMHMGAVVTLLVQANPECVKVADRRGNYPLHVSVNYGLPLDIVKRLYAMYPKALQMRNFHSETPLDIAQRSTRCSEDVMNFLQSTAFSPLENTAAHMDNINNPNAGYLEDCLDDIMETNF